MWLTGLFLGGWFVGVAKKIAGKFGSRERRHIEFFPGRAQLMTRMRRKRFVGKVMCEYMAPSLCKGSKALCKGEFVNEGITNHSTQEDTTPLFAVPKCLYWMFESVNTLRIILDKCIDIDISYNFILDTQTHNLGLESRTVAYFSLYNDCDTTRVLMDRLPCSMSAY